MNIRDGIYQSLWASGALLVISLLASAVWLTLSVMGDAGGASGAKGVLLVSSGLWAVNFIGLVMMTAIATLQVGDNTSCN